MRKKGKSFKTRAAIRTSKIMLIFKLICLLIGIHIYVFLSALIYHSLESPSKTETPTSHVDLIVDKYFTSPSKWPKKSKADLVQEIKSAVRKEDNYNMKKSFASLSKAYLFSLTTITTVGNAGLYLQTDGGRVFFIVTNAIGMAFYVTLIHYFAIVMLTILKQGVDFALMKKLNTNDLRGYQLVAKLLVVVLTYFIGSVSLGILGLGGLISGHGYMFGVYVVADTVLTAGNFNILAYVYAWNEIGFVVCVNVILLIGLTLLYAAVYLSFQFAIGSDFNELIDYWWGVNENEDYQLVDQDEETPFDQFLSNFETTKKNKKKKGDKLPLVSDDESNPFVNEGEKEAGLKRPLQDAQDALIPTFLISEASVSEGSEKNPFLESDDGEIEGSYMPGKKDQKDADEMNSVDLSDTDSEEIERSDPESRHPPETTNITHSDHSSDRRTIETRDKTY